MKSRNTLVTRDRYGLKLYRLQIVRYFNQVVTVAAVFHSYSFLIKLCVFWEDLFRSYLLKLNDLFFGSGLCQVHMDLPKVL
jgi:hypothetical protein